MGLKQIKDVDRITFLKDFVRELLLNSIKDIELKKRIESEKIKQKFIKPVTPAEEVFKQIIKNPLFKPKESILKEEKKLEGFQPSKFKIEVEESTNFTEKNGQKTGGPLIQKAPLQILTRRNIPSFMKPKVQSINTAEHIKPTSPIEKATPQIKALNSVQPVAEKRPEGFNLGKVEQLLKDPSIQSIECPGPGRNILVKKYNKINITQINLNQAEITEIIDNFSKEAKIPVLGGILKAAISDLVISAIVSEFVGSRFIINRITPYSMLIK